MQARWRSPDCQSYEESETPVSARKAHQPRQRLTLIDLQTRDARAYAAFMDFTEAQSMFWELSVGPAGDLWAEDWQMDTRIQWMPAIGQWE
jgi:hypothetical protein